MKERHPYNLNLTKRMTSSPESRFVRSYYGSELASQRKLVWAKAEGGLIVKAVVGFPVKTLG